MAKAYVVDTSIILDHSKIIDEFSDVDIVLPVSVLREVDGHKRGHSLTAFNAREFSRRLEVLRTEQGPLHKGVAVSPTVKLQVRTNTVDHTLPVDSQLVALCKALKTDYEEVTLLSEDMYLRIIADAEGIHARSLNSAIEEEVYTGVREIKSTKPHIDKFYKDKVMPFKDGAYPNEYFIIQNGNQGALGRYSEDERGIVPIIEPKHLMDDFKTKNARQKFLVDAILNPDIDLVLVNSPAGCGKTIVSLAAALHLVRIEKKYEKVLITKSMEPVGGEDKIGFLPGSFEEKMKPWILNYLDNFSLLSEEPDIFKTLDIEVCLTMHMRGRSLHNAIVIVDECISGNQFIKTEGGKIKLSHLYSKFNKGDSLPRLQTYNEKTKLFEFDDIVSVTKKGIRDTVKITMGNRKIICTPDHKFLTENGWVEAKDLTNENPIISNEEKDLQTLDVLNEDQFQIILGSYLGDGHIAKVGNGRYRARVIHGLKQKEYCEWKASMFGSSVCSIDKNGYSQTPAFSFSTKCFSLPGQMQGGKKTHCPQWVIDKIDARGIAVWYMDDGNINAAGNNARLYTSSFDLDSQKRLVEKLSTLGISAKISKDAGPSWEYFYISIDAPGTRKLLDLVAPYVHENLNYKIKNNKPFSYHWDSSYKNYRHIIVDSVSKFEPTEVFDIEMKCNHNFILTASSRGKNEGQSGVVVHNCQNLSPIEMKTIVSRMGENSKLICLGDTSQIDKNTFNKHYNGLAYTMNKFKKYACSATIELITNERSSLSKLATEIM